MKIQPARDIVLIKAAPAKQQTETGFWLAENWRTLPMEGKVLAVGDGVRSVEVGDDVIFMRYASIVLENEERLVKETHILAGFHRG